MLPRMYWDLPVSCTKTDMFKSEFLRSEDKEQIGRENKGNLKLAFILNIFRSSSTAQCNAVFMPLYSPSFRFAASLILYMTSLHVSTACYQHNAHSFNKQHHSPLMGLGWIISEIWFRGLKYIGFRAIFTWKCLSQTFDVLFGFRAK